MRERLKFNVGQNRRKNCCQNLPTVPVTGAKMEDKILMKYFVPTESRINVNNRSKTKVRH